MQSRTINTKQNILAGLVRQSLEILLPFIVRTIVIYSLGELYQGLSGLFTAILQVLSLAELGFSTVVTFSLFKPIADDDKPTICAIVAYLRKVYKIVGLVILGVGIVILPFIKFFIKADYPQDINIYVLYAIYLLNSVISYFFYAYKSTLLSAYQKESVVNNVYSIISIGSRILQIIVLLLTKNYYLFVAVLLIGSIANNLLIQHYSKKYYPEIQPRGEIQNLTKSEITKQIKGIMINRLADTARNSFDNIIISTLIGLTAVAIYGNYYYVYSALYGVSLVIIHAMQASVGNSIATESIEKNYKDLQKFTMIFSWFTGWCTVCMCCLYQPFMNIWMVGKPYLVLSNFNMILFCIYFYAITMNNTRNLYVNGNGIFWELRYYYIAEALGNLVLNIGLGYLWGITGVLIATIITIFVFNFVARTNKLFQIYFKQSPKVFYGQHALYFVITLITAMITFLVCSIVHICGITGLIIKAIICVFLPNIVFYVSYSRMPLFGEAKSFVKKVFFKKG